MCEIRALVEAADAANSATCQAINDIADAHDELVDPATADAFEGKDAELYATLLEGAERLSKCRRAHKKIMEELDARDDVEVLEDEVLHDAPRHSIH